MRKTKAYIISCIKLLSALFTLSLISCTAFDIEIPSILKDYPIHLNVSTKESTKVAVDNLDLSWEDSDKIQLNVITDAAETGDTLTTAILNYFQTIGNEKSKASFSGFVTLRKQPEMCYFTHPVGEAIAVDANNHTVKVFYTQQNGSHVPFLYGKSDYVEEGMDVTLTHLAAVLEITVNTPDVKTISLLGNKKEALSPVIFDSKNNDKVTRPTEAVTQITVPVQENGPTYIFVPPINFENGFSLVCSKGNDTNSEYFIKSYTDGVTNGYDFTSKRGVKIPITIGNQTFDKFEIKASNINVAHTRKENLLNGTSVSFDVVKKGTPDKLIQKWSATLTRVVDGKLQVVSSTTHADGTPIPSSGTIKLTNAHEWPLLPNGQYSLNFSYTMYGMPTTVSTVVTLNDTIPYLIIEGQTSYSKYLKGDIDGANKLESAKYIEGLTIKTNVHNDIISEYFAQIYQGKNASNVDIYASDNNKASFNGGVAAYGNLESFGFGERKTTAYIKCGNYEIKADDVDFQITGLPYVADFTTGNPESWSPAWDMISSVSKDNRLVFTEKSAIRSPKFHIPKNIKVTTSCDSRHNVTDNGNSINMIITACSPSTSQVQTSGQTLTFDKTYYQAKGAFGDVSGFESKGYNDLGSSFELSPNLNSVMYSLSLGTYFLGSNTFVSFKHKIEYSK